MSELANFPILNQRATTLRDGTRDSNGDFDCVPTSIAMALQYFTGHHVEGGVLKEDVYGRDYQGGTAASAYVQLLSHFGVKLYPVDAAQNEQLVILARGHIKAGHPVLFTEVDPYCSDAQRAQGWSHVVVAYSEQAGSITVADPFIAQPVIKSDAQWAHDLLFGEIWVLEKIGDNQDMAISLSTPGVSRYFTEAPGGNWHCIDKDHNFTIGGGILTFYRTLGNSGLCGLTVMGLPNSGEKPVNPQHKEIVEQEFERMTVRYDPQHIMDNPPGAGAVYVIHQPFSNESVQQSITKAIDLERKITAIAQICKA